MLLVYMMEEMRALTHPSFPRLGLQFSSETMKNVREPNILVTNRQNLTENQPSFNMNHVHLNFQSTLFTDSNPK